MLSYIRQFRFFSLLAGSVLVVGLALVSLMPLSRAFGNLLAVQLLHNTTAPFPLWPTAFDDSAALPLASPSLSLDWVCPAAGEPCPANRILGLFARAGGDLPTAVTRLTAASQQDPQNVLARLALAYALHELGRAAEAAELWEPLASTYQRNVMGLQRLLQHDRALAMLVAAQNAADSGEANVALHHYRSVVEMFPGHLVAVAGGWQLAQASGSTADAVFFEDQARLIQVPTDTRLCDQAMDAVSYLGSQTGLAADYVDRVNSVARWLACPLPVAAEAGGAVPTVAAIAEQELAGENWATIPLRNADFENIAQSVPTDSDNAVLQPVCWTWYVRDEAQFKRSAWYGGLDHGPDQSHALRISGLWIEDQDSGANPAAYYAPCSTRLVVEPGETVAIAVTYRTATDQARAAVGLGDYFWLPPAQDWSRVVNQYTNQSAAPVVLTPGLFLFNPDTVWFDDVAVYRVE